MTVMWMPKPGFKVGRSNPPGRATPAQVSYLEILFNDCGYNRGQRTGWIRLRFDGATGYLDDLSFQQAHEAINELLIEKEI